MVDNNGKGPLEWLQEIAFSMLGLANRWDKIDANYLSKEFTSLQRQKSGDLPPEEIYEEIMHGIERIILPLYIAKGKELRDEILRNRKVVIEKFMQTGIVTTLSQGLGVIRIVINDAKKSLTDCCNLLGWNLLSPETKSEYFGKIDLVSSNTELSSDDYRNVIHIIRNLVVEAKRHSKNLRLVAETIKGFCQLSLGTEEFDAREREITKRHERAKELSELYQLNEKQNSILKKLLEQKHALTQTDLALMLNVSRTTISQNVKVLREKGLTQKVHKGECLTAKYMNLITNIGIQ